MSRSQSKVASQIWPVPQPNDDRDDHGEESWDDPCWNERWTTVEAASQTGLVKLEHPLPVMGEVSSEAAAPAAQQWARRLQHKVAVEQRVKVQPTCANCGTAMRVRGPKDSRPVMVDAGNGPFLVCEKCDRSQWMDPRHQHESPHEMRFTFDQRPFDFERPEANVIDIKTIAHALSLIPRFGGHTDIGYSVAQHSLLVREIVVEHFERPDLAREALLHDAPETWTNDIVRPLKLLIAKHTNVVQRIEAAVMNAIGCPYPTSEIVKRADGLALIVECRDLFPWRERERPVAFPHKVGHVLAAPDAERLFLEAVEREAVSA